VSDTDIGVCGESLGGGEGVLGKGTTGDGLGARAVSGKGVHAVSVNGEGVLGISTNSNGVLGGVQGVEYHRSRHFLGSTQRMCVVLSRSRMSPSIGSRQTATPSGGI